MSPYGVKIGDRWEVVSFRNKLLIVDGDPGFFYHVCVGQKTWGYVYDMGNSWTALASKPGSMNMVDGFKRRRDAAIYVLNYYRAVDHV